MSPGLTQKEAQTAKQVKNRKVLGRLTEAVSAPPEKAAA